MPDNVSIAYRGATYALGQGPQFYGIWYAASPQSQPLEWWPLTPEGWAAAWSRFASVEAPGTIRPVTHTEVAPMTGPAGPVGSAGGPPGVSLPATGSPGASGPDAGSPGARAGAPRAGGDGPWAGRPEPDRATVTRNSRIAAGLIGLGLVLGVAGLFPVYTSGVSLASQAFNLAAHAIYLAAWTLSAVLILLGGVRLAVGALFGLGTSAVTLGLFVADAGTAATSGAHLTGAGLVLSILGWLACTAGVALAAVTGPAVRGGLASARGLAGRFASQPSHDVIPLVSLILAAVGIAIAFAPAWDSFTLQTAAGTAQTVKAGNAFANPGAVIAGDVLAMIAIVAVVVLAAVWRPLRMGAALALGAAVPMVAQAISAIVQISEPVSPQLFGIPPGQASQLGLSIHSGLTPMFWVYCAFLGTLILLCAWMLVAHGPLAGSPLVPGAAAPISGGSAAGGPVPGGPAPGGPAAGGYPAGGQAPNGPAASTVASGPADPAAAYGGPGAAGGPAGAPAGDPADGE